MKILGIDPGTAICGYGMIEENKSKIKHLFSGCITSTKKETLVQRLDKIYQELLDLIRKEKPDAVAVEELFLRLMPRPRFQLVMPEE